MNNISDGCKSWISETRYPKSGFLDPWNSGLIGKITITMTMFDTVTSVPNMLKSYDRCDDIDG